MKRSEINRLVQDADACFKRHGWTLPPSPRWDVTDFGLGTWRRFGLVLVNLAEEAEYCEKLMYARRGMETPAHSHRLKKEDIICRAGGLRLTFWPDLELSGEGTVEIKRNGAPWTLPAGETVTLGAGERVTIEPGIAHSFAPMSDEAVIGEVSTANDDQNDNFFANPEIGRFPNIEEDERPIVRLVSEDSAKG